jgi:acetolactate synthase-1/2/3 large subunit
MGAMGTGIPGAIGACIAAGKRTICVNGDGGFQLNIQELEVVRRLKLNIKFFVLNNGGYAAILNTQRKYFDSHYVGANEPDLTLPPLKKIADVYDLKYYLLEDEKDVQSICKQALSGNEPCLVEVIESVDQYTVMRVETKIVDGRPVSGKFEEV